MENKQIIRASKFLSKYLRHEPEALGLVLQPGGWVQVDDLLAACTKHNMRISREQLNTVVAENNKQRFSFDESGVRIRANQGHSTEVDLELQPVEPPPILYHGTAVKNVDSIQRSGLTKHARHHVHLSRDTATAHNVGSRHGKPIIFEVNAAAITSAGYCFYCSENGVWLTDEVPSEFLKVVAD